MTELILEAYRIVDEIKQSDHFKLYSALNKQVLEDLKAEIKAFEDAKNKYQEVTQTGGRHHPDFKKVTSAYLESKKVLFEQDVMKQYLALERKLQNELNAFTLDIQKIISSNLKVPNEFGMIPKQKGHCK